MIKVNQTGRTMIEMLGVIAIFAVLTVAALAMISKTSQKADSMRITSEISGLINSSKKLACDYDSGYSTYTNMLYQSDTYPETLNYDSGKFKGRNNITYEIKTTDNNETFTLTVSNLPQKECVDLASYEWGTSANSGFVKICIDGTTDCSQGVEFDISAATTKCKNNGKLVLVYKACP